MSEEKLIIRSSRFSLYFGLGLTLLFFLFALFFVAVLVTADSSNEHLGRPLGGFLFFLILLLFFVRNLVKNNIRITFCADRLLVERPWFALFPMKRHFRMKEIHYSQFDVLDIGQRGRGGRWWEFRRKSKVIAHFYFVHSVFMKPSVIKRHLERFAGHVTFTDQY